jgi:hypothetical protein
MSEARDEVLIRTEHGTFKVPEHDLEKYRVDADDLREEHGFDFDVEKLRPNSTVSFHLGTKPIVQQRGYLVLSQETRAGF